MSTDSATLNALAAEVEAGTGPDRELDARVWCALLAPPPMEIRGATKSVCFALYDPPYTVSVDAALALLREVLPGWGYTVWARYPDLGVSVDLEADGQRPARSNSAPTLPRATVAAVLRAVAARGEGT